MTTAPAIVVRADARDHRIFAALVQYGYRLIGSPAAQARAITEHYGIPITPLDLSGNGQAEPDAAERGKLYRCLESIETLPLTAWQERFGLRQGSTAIRLKRAIREHILDNFWLAESTYDACYKAFREQDVSLVYLRSALSLTERAMIAAANTLHIPTVHLPHGSPVWSMAETEGAAKGNDQTLPTAIACYGRHSAGTYQSFGVPNDQLWITGNPVWDSYCREPRRGSPEWQRQRVRTLTELGLDPKLPTVMVTGTQAGYLNAQDMSEPAHPWRFFAEVMGAVRDVAQRRPLQLIIKPHPGAIHQESDAEMYREAARDAGLPSCTILGYAEPHQIAAADCMVAWESNIGIEAILLGVPLVVYHHFPLRQDSWLFRPADPVLRADSPSLLVEQLDLCLGGAFASGKEREYAASSYRFNYLPDGRATERVLWLLVMWLAAPPKPPKVWLPPAFGLVNGGTMGLAGQEQHILCAGRLRTEGRQAEADYVYGLVKDA